MVFFEVTNCASQEDGYTNRAFVHKADGLGKSVAISTVGSPRSFFFSLSSQPLINPGCIAINTSGRKWASLQTGAKVEVQPVEPQEYLTRMQVQIDYMSAKYAKEGERIMFDTLEMNKQFLNQAIGQVFTTTQLLTFVFSLKKKVFFELKIKSLEAIRAGADIRASSVETGVCTANTLITFEKASDYVLNLCGDLAGSKAATQIINPDFDFQSMGIGGLSDQFSQVFIHAFACRLLPPQVSKKLGLARVRGMLLFGPPGTGKTLLARQIGNVLNARPPKVVTAPEIMNKFVGESEANIRKLFIEAEEEQKKLGDSSGLHVIIIDEIDAICRARGMVAGAHTDSVVNQLLSKMDGVEVLDNILLIGMTNHKSLIDPALLRPGRFELQVEIGLPDEEGRRQILMIHTQTARDNGKLAPDVDINELAKITKNFSGAELKGLVRAAGSIAVSRIFKHGHTADTIEDPETVVICMGDFLAALQNKSVTPALGAGDTALSRYAGSIIIWDPCVNKLIQDLAKIVTRARREPLVTLLLHGEKGSGLTTLAATMARRAQFPFTRFITMDDVGSEARLKKIYDDASCSELSCIVFNDIDLICEHRRGQLSKNILNRFEFMCRTLPQEGKNLLFIATCSDRMFVEEYDLKKMFTRTFCVPCITLPKQLSLVIEDFEDCPFDVEQRAELFRRLDGLSLRVGIKKVLESLSMLEDYPQQERLQEFIDEFDRSGYITM